MLLEACFTENKKEESHGIRFNSIHWDFVNISFKKLKVRNNWTFFWNWMHSLINDLMTHTE